MNRVAVAFREGLIKEEAEVRAGSSANLQAAINRGDVLVRSHRGRQTYFFPTIKLGQVEETDEQQTMSRSKATDTASFKTVQDMTSSFSWSLNSGGGSLEAWARMAFARVCFMYRD